MTRFFIITSTISLLFSPLLSAKPLLIDDFSSSEAYSYINNSVDLVAYDTSSSCMKISASGDYLITPEVTAPVTVSFTIRSTNNTVKLVVEEGDLNGSNEFIATNSSEIPGDDTSFSQRIVELSGESRLRFKKLGTGSVYIDDLKIVDNDLYLQKKSRSSLDLRFGLDNPPIFVGQISKSSEFPVVPTDTSFSFTTSGDYEINDLAASDAFTLYLSEDMNLSDDDVLIEQKNAVGSGQNIQFSTVPISLNDIDKHILVIAKLASSNPTPGERGLSLSMEPVGLSNKLENSAAFKLRSSENIVAGNYSGWAIAPANSFVPSENLLSSGLLAGQGTITVPSKVAHGEWNFTLKYDTDWNTSTQNNFFVILTADKSTDLTYDNLDFNGYFLRFSTTLEFCRQDGTTTVVLSEFTLPTSTRAPIVDYDFVIHRNNSAEWELKINDNSQFVLTDETYRSSSYFAVSKKINNPSSEKQVNIENLEFGESSISVTPLIGISLGFLDDSVEIDLLDFSIISEIKLFYMKDGVKTLHTTIVPDRSYFLIDIHDIESDLWFAEITEVEGETETFYIDNEKKHESLALHAGWNLLSTDECNNFGQSLQDKQLSIFWIWQDGFYEVAPAILPIGQAFWVYSDREVTLDLAYYPKEYSFQHGDEQGWELCPGTFILENFNSNCYGYNGSQYEQVEQTEQLKPFRGYWLFMD